MIKFSDIIKLYEEESDSEEPEFDEAAEDEDKAYDIEFLQLLGQV